MKYIEKQKKTPTQSTILIYQSYGITTICIDKVAMNKLYHNDVCRFVYKFNVTHFFQENL